MEDPIIKIDRVSKSYQLSGARKKGGIISGLFGRSGRAAGGTAEDENLFWALKDVSLEIPSGSMVGILGLNGAGKSTFLKLVSGALQPTGGSIEKAGDVALIELGAGFNPHLTARENIRLLGRQKGFSGAQIDETISYVEEFADIGIFFDQPMNTYSSGMQSRVGFGNAFSVDPDILIVDEALSVGDASFSNKCFRRIEDLRSRGKSILFASHDRNTVSRLCDLGMVLDHGELKFFGSSKEAAFCYERIIDQASAQHDPQSSSQASVKALATDDEVASPGLEEHWQRHVPVPKEVVEGFLNEPIIANRMADRAGFNPYSEKIGTGNAEIVDYLVYPDSSDGARLRFAKLSAISILFKAVFHAGARHPAPGLQIKNREGVLLYGGNTILKEVELKPAKPNECRVYCISLELQLPSEQEYFISLAIADGTELHSSILHDKREALMRLEITGRHDATGICDIPATFQDVAAANLTEPVEH